MSYPQQQNRGGTLTASKPKSDQPSNTEDAKKLIPSIVFSSQPSEKLFDEHAREMAKIVADCRKDKENKSTQLRKFYDELTMWSEKVQSANTNEEKQKNYGELAPFIKMLNAKVAYARGREHVDEAFELLFTHCIREIKDAKSLNYCKLFIEAFMGFYKVHKK